MGDFFSPLVPGRASFKCYECESHISMDDCDENKTLKNCNSTSVFLGELERWEPVFDRCLKIVDETLDPPWISRSCGFRELYLHYIRDKCHKPLCTVEACFDSLCSIGGNKN